MITKETLRQIIIRQKNDLNRSEDTVRREILDDILKWLGDRRIIILTGIRRSGKSTLLRQAMRNTSDFCYANFEDERFMGFKANDFEQLNEVLAEVYGDPKIYFFDEIQNIEKFEIFVRRLHDQGKKVVMTGSNASLLSKELGTRLTGRYKSFEIFPFSFTEYLAFKNVKYRKEWLYITVKKANLIKLFGEYFSCGGFPEYLKNKDMDYIRTLFENILYRDIIARYSIKRQKAIRELVNLLSNNISLLFTYNSLKKALGLSNSITVKEYISYLDNSYLFFELQKFDFSIKKQLNSPKKIFLIDQVFNRLVSFSINKGRILENIVFIELKRRNGQVFYYSGKNECDFVIKKGNRISEAMQVCYVLSENNRKREIDGLLEAMDRFSLKKSVILTHDQEEEISVKGKKIRVLPVWKWLMRVDQN